MTRTGTGTWVGSTGTGSTTWMDSTGTGNMTWVGSTGTGNGTCVGRPGISTAAGKVIWIKVWTSTPFGAEVSSNLPVAL